MSKTAGAKKVGKILDGAQNVLIVTHVRPDGDATGSAFGLKHLLQDWGKNADVFFPEPAPDYAVEFLTEYKTELSAEELEKYDLLVITDAAAPERVACGNWDIAELLKHNTLCIDHHENNSVNAAVKWVEPRAAAASAMIAEIANQYKGENYQLPVQAATFLLLGMTTDSGCFRFSNTNPRLFFMAALALNSGVEWSRIINAVYFSKSRQQQLFEADFIQNHVQIAADGKLAYAMLPQSLFDKYGFDMRNGETLIDLLREIKGAAVSFHCYKKGNDVKFSFRSKDENYPVLPVARKFGGGGHLMAAGLTLPDAGLEESCERIKNTLVRYLNGESWE